MRKIIIATIAATAFLTTGTAHAETIYWSVGINSPVAGTVISNSPHFHIQPSVVYVSHPQVVYAPPSPQVIYQQPIVEYKRSIRPRHHHHRHSRNREDYRGDKRDHEREYYRD